MPSRPDQHWAGDAENSGLERRSGQQQLDWLAYSSQAFDAAQGSDFASVGEWLGCALGAEIRRQRALPHEEDREKSAEPQCKQRREQVEQASRRLRGSRANVLRWLSEGLADLLDGEVQARF